MLPGRAGSFYALSVGGLRLELDARESGISLALPPSHGRFAAAGEPGGLRLAVRLGRLRKVAGWRPLCTDFPTWQLWRDRQGWLVFVAGEGSRPRRQVTVDGEFRRGEVVVEPDSAGAVARPLDPLAGLDIVLFANWLAASGDLILHASGVEFEGRGYGFVGVSGAGKSTIAAAFAGRPGVRLLGEDNIVLRCLDGRFRLFGTPWHLNPPRCSPGSAALEKLFCLDRTLDAGTYDCPPARGIEQLLQTAFLPYYRPDVIPTILENLARLAEQASFHRLSYRVGSDVMELIREA